MPVGVDQRRRAGLVELGELGIGQLQRRDGKVVGQLLRRARADDQRGDGGLGQYVGQRDLGGRDAARLGDADQRLDDVVQALLIVDRWLVPVGEAPRSGRGLLAPAVLAGQQAARKRAPDQDPEALVDRERYQFVLRLAGLQRVVDLLADEPRQAEPFRGAEGLHQLPGGVVGGTDVAHLALLDQQVERPERLLERGLAVPLVHLVQVDVVGAEAAQARLAAGDDVLAGKAGVVRAVSHRHPHLGGDEHPVPAAGQHLAEDLL